VTDLEARQASRDTLTGAVEASGQRFAVTSALHSIKDNISMRSSNFPSRPSRRSVLIGGTAFGALTSMPRGARAEQWPSRPVKLVVPFAAGGTTDILARVVAAKVSEEFGQQFIVENKAGAGGNIAADAVAKADPDGYLHGGHAGHSRHQPVRVQEHALRPAQGYRAGDRHRPGA
jgi:hypothetical protein